MPKPVMYTLHPRHARAGAAPSQTPQRRASMAIAVSAGDVAAGHRAEQSPLPDRVARRSWSARDTACGPPAASRLAVARCPLGARSTRHWRRSPGRPACEQRAGRRARRTTAARYARSGARRRPGSALLRVSSVARSVPSSQPISAASAVSPAPAARPRPSARGSRETACQREQRVVVNVPRDAARLREHLDRVTSE